MLTTRDGPAVIDAKVRYWSKIAIFCHSYAGPRRNISITCGYPDGEKNFQIDIFTQYENVTDRQRAMAQAALMHSIARQKTVALCLQRILPLLPSAYVTTFSLHNVPR